jgi:hypothetical protein
MKETGPNSKTKNTIKQTLHPHSGLLTKTNKKHTKEGRNKSGQ